MTLQGPPVRRSPLLLGLGRFFGLRDVYVSHPHASTMSTTSGSIPTTTTYGPHTSTIGPRGRNLTGLGATSFFGDFLTTVQANPVVLIIGVAAGIWAAKKYGGAK